MFDPEEEAEAPETLAEETTAEEELGMVESNFVAEEVIQGTLDADTAETIRSSGWLSYLNPTNLTIIFSILNTQTFYAGLRPVSEFAGPSQFEKPTTKTEVVARLSKNYLYFFSNYVILFCVFLVFTILTQPFLLICTAGIGYGWWWASKQESISLGPVALEGSKKSVTLSILTALAILCVAGSSIVWVLFLTMGASAVHSVCHKPVQSIEDNNDDVEIEPFV